MEKYGFVYIWYDRKHKRFYIGCHWGTEDDGYICSSNWMRDAYRRRPEDFKRRVISVIKTNRIELLKEEYKWLSMIKNEELKIKYYNLSKRHFGHWVTNEQKKQSISERMIGNKIMTGRKRPDTSEKMKGNSYGKVHKGKPKPPRTKEHSLAISKAKKGNKGSMLGRKWSDELRRKIYEIKGTEEYKTKISIAIKLALAKKKAL